MAKLLKTPQQDSELLYRSVFESTLEGMELIDAQTRMVVTANQAMASIFGFASPEEMVGLNPLDYIPTEDRDRVARMIDEDMFQNNLRLVLELRAMTRDGREIWLSALGVRIEYQGRLAGLISVRDITAQKLRERKIEASKEETRLLVENAGKAIVVVQDGVLKFANSKVTEITGYSGKEMISSPFTEFIHPDDQPTVAELYLQSLRGEEIPHGSIVRSVGKEGNVIWFGLKAVSFTWEEKPAVWLLMSDITERKKAEEALRESEKRYRLLAENISDVIWVTDMNMRPTYLSPSITRLLGYSMEEAMARGMQDSLTPASLKIAADAVASVVDAERKWQKDAASMIPPLELEMVRKDGSTLWVASKLSLLYDSSGQPTEMMGVLHDITERKKSEDALRESEAQYHLLADHMKDQVWLMDLNLKTTYISPSVEKMRGYTLEEIAQLPLDKHLTATSLQSAMEFFSIEMPRAQADPTYLSRPLELEFYRKDGSTLWVENAFSLIRDQNGKPWYILGVGRDITERKKAEEKLQRREQRFQALTEHSSDVILIVSAEGTIRYISPSVELVLGISPVEAIGTSVLEYIQQETIRLVADDFARLLQNPGASMQTEICGRHKDGTWRTLEGTATNLLHDPAVEGIVINYRDITERKKAQQELAQSEKKYRQLVETLNEGIWAIDKDSNTTFVNPRMAEMLGYTTDEMVGRHLFAFMDERGVEIAKYNLGRRQQGIKERHDFEFLRKDEARIYASLETSPIIDDKGDYAGAIAGVQDITERRKVEQALAESEVRYRLLAENLSDVIWIMDTNFRYSYMSPSITRLQGYTVEEAMAQPLEENLTPASLEAAMQIMAEEDAREHTGQYDPNRTVTMQVELYRKDGSTVWVENVSTYLRDSNGQVTGYLGVSRDITERREATKQRERSFRNLEKAMNGTVQAIALTVESRDRYTAGHQKRVAQLGCAIARKLGFTSDQIQGIRIAGLLHDIGKISVPQELLSKPGKLTDIEFRLIKAHSQTGYDILKPVEFPWPIADIVVQHHERMNGSGYPSGIREDKLLMEARILGVADVVEAMSSNRPYRAPLGIDKALEEISRNSGILYDPSVVDACLWVFSEKGFEFED